MKIWNIIFIEISILCLSTVIAHDKNSNLLPQSIIDLKKYYDLINNLEKRGIINNDIANEEKRLYIEHASKIIGSKRLLTEKEFITWEKQQMVISFSNVIAIIAAVTVIISLTVLIGKFMMKIVADIPIIIWEILFYSLSFWLMFITKSSWLIFLGCLTFVSTLLFTNKSHFSRHKYSLLATSWICFFIFSITAIYQQNCEAGYLAVMALEASLGFVIFVGELVIMIGFHDEKLIPTGTIASFVLIIIGIILHVQKQTNLLTIPFTRPLLFLGTFVYFIGILILSSRLYRRRTNMAVRFWFLQIIGFLSGLLSMFIAPMLDLPFVEAIGGTMFVIWLLEKYVEIVPWKNTVTTSLSLFGFGLLLYGLAYFLKTNPQYFIFS